MTSRVSSSHELRDYLAVMFRWSWLLALCAAVAGGGAYIGTKREPPVYRATTLVVVDQRGVGQGSYSDALASNQAAATYAGLIPQPIVLQKAAKQVPGASVQALSTRVQASARVDTSVIEIQVDDTSPARAAALANAVADAFIELQQKSAQDSFQRAQQELAHQSVEMASQISLLNNQITRLQASNPSSPDLPTLRQQLDALLARRSTQEGVSAQLTQQYVITSNNVRVFQPAIPPTQPDHPRPLTYGAIGSLLGLVIATTVVLLWRDTLGDWSPRMIASLLFRRERDEPRESGAASARPAP